VGRHIVHWLLDGGYGGHHPIEQCQPVHLAEQQRQRVNFEQRFAVLEQFAVCLAVVIGEPV
jgi:hypothetical protein